MLASVLIIVISVLYKKLAGPLNYKFHDDNIIGITVGVILGLLFLSVIVRIVRAIVKPKKEYSDSFSYVKDIVFAATAIFVLTLMAVGYTVKDDQKMNHIMSIVTILLWAITVITLWVLFIRGIADGFNPVFLLQVFIFKEFTGFVGGIFGGLVIIIIIAISLIQLFLAVLFTFVGLFGIFSDDGSPITFEDVIIFHIIMDHIKG